MLYVGIYGESLVAKFSREYHTLLIIAHVFSDINVWTSIIADTKNMTSTCKTNEEWDDLLVRGEASTDEVALIEEGLPARK